ncbi:hypothetical protein TSAR_001767 [Trichomalopsis sarcophagae]|uniref:Uncharacterized protein n=1 Tax=Trichomalopsis sarcophagae TaxID=543379 RepID=A0A232EK22_9HYME|nr:hypothetical protein TSAR_001767 [Trichomalopsis sarcophagae]
MKLNLWKRSKKKIYIYKKTNWDTFEKSLNKNYKRDTHIDNLQNATLKSIEETTPVLKYKNRLEKIINHKILKLYESKHKIQTHIHRMQHINDTSAQLLIIRLKAELKNIKKSIKQEFTSSSNKN